MRAWILPLVVVVGCSAEDGSGPAGECSSSAECGPGLACVDGRCERREPGDAGVDPAADGDGDGISDVYEGRFDSGGPADTDGDGTPDHADDDSDGDGVPDSVEGGMRSPSAPPDTDTDGVPDFRDDDSDGDGISDAREGGAMPPDTDGDGRPDYVDRDSDGDTLDDGTEGAPAGGDGAPADTDGDGTGDFRDLDTDADSIPDADELGTDDDADGIPNWRDPRNDCPTSSVSLTLTAISTTFNSPIGIDYHEPTNSVVMSVNYSAGVPLNFERVEMDGTHTPFSTVSGLTEEVKIATARSGNPAGFVAGDLFVGNGIDGQIVRITDGGATVINPWSDLPGDGNGLMRGALFVDRFGVIGGDLAVVTTSGQVWRVTSGGTPTMIAAVPGVHLEGMIVVPDAPARYGPLAGKIIAGAEAERRLYAFAPDGTVTPYDVPVAIEDIDRIDRDENFFGVNFGTSRLLGAPASEFTCMIGDILLAQESPTGGTSLFRLRWDGTTLVIEEIPLAAGSATVGQWEHVTFAPAGIVEIPPII